jgi:XapX domain-containing protein
MTDTTIVALSLLTGLLTGAVFRYLQVPIPAPPNVAGIVGIVGIYVGYKLVGYLGWGFDLVEALGL